MRIAVIDIGTNSIRLLIGDADEAEPAGIKVVRTGLITTRLGEGIGSERRLNSTAIDRTIKALLEFKKIIEEERADEIIAAATSAVRDAENRLEFLEQARDIIGLEIRVLSGTEEAAMSYCGVVGGLKTANEAPVVVDIGGGSTEFIWQGSKGINFESLRIGAVRMTEMDSGLADIKLLMSEVIKPVKSAGYSRLIGVGGTVTTLAAIDMELTRYDPELVHGYHITRQRVEHILGRLEGMTVEDRRSVAGLQPQRADIIIAGVRIVLAVLDGLDATGITASESDIMYGLFYETIENKYL